MRPGLRICFLAPGSSVHTRRWVVSMASRGHEVLLIPQNPAASIPIPVYDPYVAMRGLARLPKVRAIVAERLILRRIRRFDPDIVHLHWLNPTPGTVRLVRHVQPLVASVWGRDLIWDENSPEPRRRIRSAIRILAHARLVTATSVFLADRTRAFLREGQDVPVVPFGVDCTLFSPPTQRQERVIPVIGFLKHFTPKYGPEILLHAVSRLAAEGLGFRVKMYGTKDPEPYRRIVRALHLEDRVMVGGSVEHGHVPEILRGFDVYAMPSVYDSETFGVTALEASACGVPVVASRVGGVPEVVIDKVTGLLVPPSDPAALAGALARMLRDPALRLRMGEAGRDFVLRSYRWEACVDRMEDLYRRVIASDRSGRP